MLDHIENRDQIIGILREELAGPSPQGMEIDCSREISFDAAVKSYGPWRQKDSGEEILQRDRPLKRYGVGVLYPKWTLSVDGTEVDGAGEAGLQGDNPITSTEAAGWEETRSSEDPLTEKGAKIIEEIQNIATQGGDPIMINFW